MIPPITHEEALAVLRGRVDRGWLETLRSQPDGEALVQTLVDIAVEMDALDAQRASSLFVQHHSREVAPPASGPEYATTTVAITLRKQLRSVVPITMPAGTIVRTRVDGRAYRIDEALTFAPGEVGVSKSMTATALLPGYAGAVPPGEVVEFAPVANNISGIGTAIEIIPVGPRMALRFTTDTTRPHPFKAEHQGMLLQIVSVDDVAAQGNVGRVVSLDRMTPSTLYGDDAAPENGCAWGEPVDVYVDSRYSVWKLGAGEFEWRVVDWGEFFDVTNTTRVVGGREDILGELAIAKGQPRQPGEDDEMLRARLFRQPELPSPVGLLKKCIVALAPWGVQRGDIRIYELGEPAPSAQDPYAAQFPPSVGFVWDIHPYDAPDPMTSAGMLVRGGIPITTRDTGLAVRWSGVHRWVVIVRWDPPASMPEPLVKQLRALLFRTAKTAVQPGCVVQIYHPQQWSYPE